MEGSYQCICGVVVPCTVDDACAHAQIHINELQALRDLETEIIYEDTPPSGCTIENAWVWDHVLTETERAELYYSGDGSRIPGGRKLKCETK